MRQRNLKQDRDAYTAIGKAGKLDHAKAQNICFLKHTIKRVNRKPQNCKKMYNPYA